MTLSLGIFRASIADSTPLKLFAADATCPSYIATHCWGYSSINLCQGNRLSGITQVVSSE